MIEWFEALSRISLGDYQAIDFIGNELRLNSVSISKYKYSILLSIYFRAFCAKEGPDFLPLVNALKMFIDKEVYDFQL
jgi:hypothetical protein